MHYEFEQLLEALWAGRLDEAGRRRLDELCAADPALARRFRQEYNLSGLLARCGPNQAPAHLARSVMARLETRGRLPRQTPWFNWLLQPAFGAAAAIVVMAAVGVQAGLLIHKWRTGGLRSAAPQVATVRIKSTPPREREVAIARKSASTKTGVTAKRRNDAGAKSRAAAPRNAGGQAPLPASPAPQAPYDLQEFPATPDAPQAFPDSQIAMNQLQEFPQANTAVPRSLASEFAPQATPAVPQVQTRPPVAQTPRVPSAELAQVQPKATRSATERAAMTAEELADRRVAMELFLTPATRPAPSGQGGKSATPLPFASSFVNPSEAKPKAEALSCKDIEIALNAVNAENVTTSLVPGRKDIWEIRAYLTAEQFRTFITDLRSSGILPGESVLGQGGTDRAKRSHAPSYTTNHYEISRGKQWTKPPVAPDPAAGAAPAKSPAPINPRIEVKIRVVQVAQ